MDSPRARWRRAHALARLFVERRPAWALSEVRALAEPVPVRRGQLGLWRLDDVTEAAVIAAGG